MNNIIHKGVLCAATAMAAIALANPATAALFINTATNSGTLRGSDINVSFTGEFSSFEGGARPENLSFMLTSLSGTRTVDGVTYTPTAERRQRLRFLKSGRTNLWTNYNNDSVSPDYHTRITSYSTSTPGTPSTSSAPAASPVPAPGVVGLFGVGIVGLWAARRRKQGKAKITNNG